MGMKKTVLLFLANMICFSLFSQSFKKEIVGELGRGVFTSDDELKQWFVKGYDDYKPNEKYVTQLKTLLQDKTIVVVLGTWCSDTQREFPHLMKILDALKFGSDELRIFGVDK